MDVLCLNGSSVTVQPTRTLQEAKVQVAKALGAFPEAVWISCEGQVLSGETLEICLSKLELSQPPALFAVVDQKRLEMAQHLQSFEPEAVAFQKKMQENEKLRAKFAQKEKELGWKRIDKERLNFGSHLEIWQVEMRLREGNLSLLKEKALVAQLPKLRMLQKLEDQLYEETGKLYSLRSRFRLKLAQVRSDLQTALKNHDDDNDQLLAEFDDLARAREPGSLTFNFNSDASSYISWHSRDVWEYELAEWMANPRIEELKDSCPRLLRREAWCNSKRSWKYIPKVAPSECDLLDQQPRITPRKDRRRQRAGRRAMGRDLQSQLREFAS